MKEGECKVNKQWADKYCNGRSSRRVDALNEEAKSNKTIGFQQKLETEDNAIASEMRDEVQEILIILRSPRV